MTKLENVWNVILTVFTCGRTHPEELFIPKFIFPVFKPFSSTKCQDGNLGPYEIIKNDLEYHPESSRMSKSSP